MTEFEQKKQQWIAENGFNEQGITYIYFPSDSYNVKETLKDAGFIFSRSLYWHSPTIPEGYEDKVIEFPMEGNVNFAAWGTGSYVIGTKEKVNAAMRAARCKGGNLSEWIDESQVKIVDIPATLTDIRNYHTKYGISSIVRLVTDDNKILKWFTTVNITLEIGSSVLVSATIKDRILDKYEDNAKVTILTRAKLKAV